MVCLHPEECICTIHVVVCWLYCLPFIPFSLSINFFRPINVSKNCFLNFHLKNRLTIFPFIPKLSLLRSGIQEEREFEGPIIYPYCGPLPEYWDEWFDAIGDGG